MRLLLAGLAFGLAGLFSDPAAAQNNCDVSAITPSDWLSPDPTTLAEVPNGASANNCDFHIYSWRWFTYLMNPAPSGDMRNFENRAVHPVVDLDTCTSVQAGTKVDAERGFVASLPKQPDIPDQASGNALASLPRYGFDPDRVVDIVGEYGNCIAASIPMALAHADARGRISRGDTVLLLGTGAGLSVAAAVLRW